MQTVPDTQVKQDNHSVIKMINSFYSGKDLCKSEFQLLLYSTLVSALPIDGCHKGLILHHPLNHVTVAILVTNAPVKIANHILQCNGCRSAYGGGVV